MQIPFDNSYALLPGHMFTLQSPSPVFAPEFMAVNSDLARELGLDPADINTSDALAIFAGNTVPTGATPLAAAYAGHQFGNWNPSLGDGRAILLGEVIDTNGIRRDIQLKGSGRTPYSRNGDGRAWLGPVMREYLISEAMHALGVPTTRALAAITTGENIQRETVLPGAILTRVAKSHIRVGTFQFFAARGDIAALQALTNHTIARHYPQAQNPGELLAAVAQNQATLIAKWMGLGFIHGVMNTDNVSIAGETIDYGPCAFIDAYHPDTVFSSIDVKGRYAYSNQPQIGAWNMAQFATSLLPLMQDQTIAITEFTEVINNFSNLYDAAWLVEFGNKLGLDNPDQSDKALITDLLALMASDGADFTNTFADLQNARDQFIQRDAFDDWQSRWQSRSPKATNNPLVIPRNHLVEAAIVAGTQGDLTPFNTLLAAVTSPYTQPQNEAFTRPPTADQIVHRTFCGT